MTTEEAQPELPTPRPIARIVLMAEEGFLFSGSYLPEIVARLAPRLVTVATVDPPQRGSRPGLAGMLRGAGVGPTFALACRGVGGALLARLPPAWMPPRHRRLAVLARDAGVPHVTLGRLDGDGVRAWLADLRPDVVVSSVSEILRPELLAIPELGFINKHASLLPAYRGVMPVVHALARGETRVGMTVHAMTPAVDGGPILSQRAYDVGRDDSVLSAYRRIYAHLPEQIDEALAVLEGRLAPVLVQPRPQPSYHSAPTAADWSELRRRGRRLA